VDACTVALGTAGEKRRPKSPIKSRAHVHSKVRLPRDKRIGSKKYSTTTNTAGARLILRLLRTKNQFLIADSTQTGVILGEAGNPESLLPQQR